MFYDRTRTIVILLLLLVTDVDSGTPWRNSTAAVEVHRRKTDNNNNNNNIVSEKKKKNDKKTMCRVNAAKRFSNDCTGRGVNAQYARPRRRLVHRLTASRRSSVGTGSAPPCVSRRAFKAASEPAAAAVLPPICRVPRSPARCSYATGTHVQPSCRPPSPPYRFL